MKGYRTLILNGAIVIGTAALTWVAGVNWSEYVNPTVAMVLVGAANIGLRMITTSAVGTK
jgi:hypothetical protein